MKIQFGHKRSGDFINNFYIPLREKFLKVDWIFPHLTPETQVISEESLKDVDVFLVEVSQQATGIGIEIGFAKVYGKRIICMYKSGSEISSSLKYVTDEIIEYSNISDMIEKIQKTI